MKLLICQIILHKKVGEILYFMKIAFVGLVLHYHSLQRGPNIAKIAILLKKCLFMLSFAQIELCSPPRAHIDIEICDSPS